MRLLDALLDPATLLGIHDVHVLDADRAAVGVAQDPEHAAQLHEAACAAEGAGGELAVEVPQRQPVLLDLEVGVAALLVLQRVGVGHQVAAHAVGVDQLEDAGLLADVLVVAGRDVLRPADRLVGDPQRAEDLVVEAVVAEQQLVHGAQELARLRALDDTVVVGRGQRHDARDRVAGQRLLGGALELRRVVHRADADDGGLALHEARHGVVGAEATDVGQADRGAGVVLHRQLVVLGLAHDLLVRRPELGEVHRLAALDRRGDELARAVGLLLVDGQAEVDVRRRHHGRLAVDLGEGVVHGRLGLDRLDDRVADEVGEGDLAAARALEVVVDDDAVVPQQLDRDGAHAGRGRDREREVHVLGGGGGDAAQHGVGRLVARRRGSRGLRVLRDRLRGAGAGLGGGGRGPRLGLRRRRRRRLGGGRGGRGRSGGRVAAGAAAAAGFGAAAGAAGLLAAGAVVAVAVAVPLPEK